MVEGIWLEPPGQAQVIYCSADFCFRRGMLVEVKQYMSLSLKTWLNLEFTVKKIHNEVQGAYLNADWQLWDLASLESKDTSLALSSGH